MVKYILWGLIVLSPLNRMSGEDFPFFPIGAWGAHGGKDYDSLILRASGINLLISGWGYPDKADYWDQAAKNNGLKLNVQWPKPGTPYYSAGEYYYECTQTLLDNYPVQIDEDSLAFWKNLKATLISAIANSYTSDSFSIFCTSLSFYNHQTRPLHVPGIRAMCDGANPNGRSLGYITWKWFLPLVKPYLQVNTCIVNKSKPDSMNPGNGDYNDLLQSQFNELIEKDTAMQTAHDSAGIEFWPQLVLQRDKKTRRPIAILPRLNSEQRPSSPLPMGLKVSPIFSTGIIPPVGQMLVLLTLWVDRICLTTKFSKIASLVQLEAELLSIILATRFFSISGE